MTDLTNSLLSNLQIPISQINQVEQDGNIVINLHTEATLPVKSITIHFISNAPEMIQDFNLIPEGEGYFDHQDYEAPVDKPELVLSEDDKL